ncbi:RICIN domain-containing protein [Streptomyces sp. NBC_01142]|uniref:RICIN domain-containing protein n=1 Tax=Streptomyces sp. NBC_01142 TaxID=2975865 RepID=UPI0022590966|nr:RICIN domain-containing protein [Streptomyces sp. NBC_01142]MCX4825956.1 RICIN domain-containing protein [Streptomyces sp. NBC_01142]
MPKFHPDVWGTADGDATFAGLSDAKLMERIRSGAPAAYPAAQELKRRHLPTVLTYARLCARTWAAGNQLAAQAIQLAAQEACRGIEPRGTWRHHLLMLVQRVALTWASGKRRHVLEPDFATWLDEAADSIDPNASHPQHAGASSSAMLTGFYWLAEATQCVLWHAVVDDEPDATVATFLQVEPAVVPELRTRAQDAMRQAYIQAHVESSGDRRCLGFRRIIEAAAQPGDGRYSQDLAEHLDECPSCPELVAELKRMTDDPRTALAQGLLRWGGAAYAARTQVRGLLGEVLLRPPSGSSTPVPATAVGGTGSRRRENGPSLPLVLVAVAVAAAALTIAVVGMQPGSIGAGSGAAPDRSEEPPVQDVPTIPAIPVPNMSTSPTPTPSKSPAPSASATTKVPSKVAPKPKPPAPSKVPVLRPVPIVAGGGYTRIVNDDSGLCLAVEGGVLENYTDVVSAGCTGAPTQLWSLDSSGLLRSSADSDYCVDSRGDVDRGVGIWRCSDVQSRDGLLFIVDGSGTIRPRIAPGFALEPLLPDSLELEFDEINGESEQHWTAVKAAL